MGTAMAPDLLARPLAKALAMAEKAGWQVEIRRAEPFFRRKELVWSDGRAYVLKQVVESDHKLLLYVGCRF